MRALSLFSGAGGLDLGMSAAGVHAEVSVELDTTFASTLSRNLPGTSVLVEDVGRLRAADLVTGGSGEIDVMFGGPPCQSFSTGGGRAGLTDPRGNLIFEYLRLIAEIRPRMFVLENVANLITAALRHRPIQLRPGKNWNLAAYSSKNVDRDGVTALEPDEMSGTAIRYLLDEISQKTGYQLSVGILDASAFGAPQRRLRLVIMGSREKPAPSLPAPTHGTDLLPRRTVRDAIEDLAGSTMPGAQYTPEVRAVFDMVPEGGNWRSLPADVARRALGERSYAAGGGKTGFFRRLAWDQPSPTVTGRPNRKGSAMCHPAESRPVSVRETARLQGFPDSWQFQGSMASQYLQIGNAVPVALAEAIGRAVTTHLDSASSFAGPSTADMLADAKAVLRASARNNRAA